MSLDQKEPPINLDEAIQYGRDDAVERLSAAASAEAKIGDGRALRALQRLLEKAGLRRND